MAGRACESTRRMNVPSAVALALCGQSPQIAEGRLEAPKTQPGIAHSSWRMAAVGPLPAHAGCGKPGAESSRDGDRAASASGLTTSSAFIPRRFICEAWLSPLREGNEAAAEFQKIIDHKGVYWGPFYSVSYVGVARGAALAGDMPRSRKAYQDFFALWKDADADIPILK